MSYTYLQEQGEESSAECFSDIPQYALSKSKSIPARYCFNDSETESLTPFPYGMTSALSTADLGPEQLTFWPEAGPVKTSQTREQTTERSLELTEIAQAYGRSIKESLAKCGLNLCLPKTPQICELAALSPSSKTLPSWGMAFDGASLEVATLVRITEERESGYLPTPLANDWKGGSTAIRKDTGKQRLDQWRDYVKVKYGMTYPHPTHSELRMGWPEKWSVLEPLEMDKFLLWLDLHGKPSLPDGYSKVVFADDCRECEFCDDVICPVCDEHYADCDCIGPTEDDVEYEEIDGVIYGKRLKDETHNSNTDL